MDDKISVVVPLFNEAENIKALVEEIQSVAHQCPIMEIILVDDASTDDTARIIRDIKSKNNRIRLLRHSNRAGQSAALRTGIRAATEKLVVMLDGDGQNDPANISVLYAKWTERENRPPMCMVAGQRRKRMDNTIKIFASRTGNRIRRCLLKDGVRDTGCSLKLFRAADYLTLPYFDHMHRFLPALFLREHGTILLVDVGHRARERGVSKYGFWDRLWAGIFDIGGVLWLKKRASVRTSVTEE